MKKYLVISIVLVFVGVLVSCGTRQTTSAYTPMASLNGEWKIVELNGKSLNASETGQTINFDIPRLAFSGNAGCNRMSGNIEFPTNTTNNNVIKFLQVISTRMACPDMSGEQELFKVLDNIVRYEASPATGKVIFYGMDNTRIMVIER
ncbi:MAG: META domain-containing protein [Tannerellaceae bacterium]|nr:META domain-containing protein [Tannerellaceae bacterium]MCD8263892.1 META domain-containing protein [Tannerellaceae bacterium]